MLISFNAFNLASQIVSENDILKNTTLDDADLTDATVILTYLTDAD